MVDIFNGKNILITGGTGSVGKDLVYELLIHKPKVIRIFDNNETELFNLQEELSPSKRIRYLFGDIRDKGRLEMALAEIDLVFHTAALKHVYISEYSPFEAVKTNIIGIQNLIEAAIDNNVEKVLFTSSDKAVNPSNVMGTSKLMGEKLIVAANTYKGKHRTRFSCVRFGNVLGTRGSLVPLAKEQIKKGGPVTITDHKMTRFVMSSNQSIKLLLKSIETMIGGEIFVLKMPTVKISDMIDVLINEITPKYGYNLKKIKTKIIGLKPGEKLYEELMTEAECSRALATKDMFIILPYFTDSGLLSENFYSRYVKLKKPSKKGYNSADSKHLSKTEIKKLLSKEGLLEE
jgi:UDP-N-acetylglucosamine 4,6-dehydratase